MAKFDALVRDGRFVTLSGSTKIGIAIKDGRIAALGSDLGTADKVIGATAKFVLPGGIDSHCHIEQETSTGLVPSDDFFVPSSAATYGNTTTIIPFACQHRGQSPPDVVAAYHGAAEKVAVDYAFHMFVSDLTQVTLKRDIPDLAGKGYTSLQIYMAYDRPKLGNYETLDGRRRSGRANRSRRSRHGLGTQSPSAAMVGSTNSRQSRPFSPASGPATSQVLSYGSTAG